MIEFLLNDKHIQTDAAPGMVVLDYVRRTRQLCGSKEGCREGDCGACTVLLGEACPDGVRYRSVASCLLPLASVAGRHVVTVEGINQAALTPVQQAIVDEGATQCGFCTPGFVVALTGFLLNEEELCEANAIASIEGNICRCTGYASLIRAVSRLIASFSSIELPPPGQRVPALIQAGILPASFAAAAARLQAWAARPSRAPASGTRVAGGTDLFVQRPDLLHDAPLRCLDLEADLQGIRPEGDTLRIGAATSTEALLQSAAVRKAVPGIGPHLRRVSSQLMRNRASVAGNLVNASPIGDISIMLLALDASLELRGAEGEARSLSLRGFFRGYKQIDLRPDEIIEAVRLPLAPGRVFNFEKVSKRPYLDIASANTALSLRLEDGIMRQVGLSAGGVAPVPLFLAQTAAALEGQPLESAVIDRAAARAAKEMTPIDDVRGSASYKGRLVQSLIRAHFVSLFPETFGEGVAL